MDVLLALLLLLQSAAGGSGHGSGAQTSLSKLWHTTELAMQQQSDGKGVNPGKPDPDGNEKPGEDPQKEDAPKVKGIYVTAYSAGGARMASLLDLVDKTALNAMVIDIKDDNGYITYKTTNPEIAKLGTPQSFIKNIAKTLQTLKEHRIYPIARIVVFKDSILAKKRPDLSYINADGTVWSNKKGDRFVNPYRKEVWDYNVAVAKEAVKMGFKEIQFDYVRFPEGFEKKADHLKFYKTQQTRTEAVTGFVEYARKQLEPLGVRVSVDIFGYAAAVPAAEGIGQDFAKISGAVNVICPMIYPSHYSTGWYKQKDPDRAPYETIKGAIADTHKKLEPLGDKKPVIRPWIQDFTASWLGKGHYIKYGAAEVNAQIKALNEAGVTEFLLWNSGNKYSPGANYGK